MTLRRGLLRAAGANGVTYAKLDPSFIGSGLVLSNGDLDVNNTGSNFRSVLADIGKTSGRWYWEVTVLGPTDGFNVGADNVYLPGIANQSITLSSFVGASGGNSVGVRRDAIVSNTSQRFYNGGISTANEWLTKTDLIEGSVFNFDLDMDLDTFTMGLDGVFGVTVDIAPSTIGGAIFPAISIVNNLTAMRANFGQNAFAHMPPVGANPGVFI